MLAVGILPCYLQSHRPAAGAGVRLPGKPLRFSLCTGREAKVAPGHPIDDAVAWIRVKREVAAAAAPSHPSTLEIREIGN
jgi:hypothetical protein